MTTTVDGLEAFHDLVGKQIGYSDGRRSPRNESISLPTPRTITNGSTSTPSGPRKVPSVVPSPTAI